MKLLNAEARQKAYVRYSMGYSATKVDPELFKKYILSNFPKDKDLIEEQNEIIHSKRV